jgi:hypothetical protein
VCIKLSSVSLNNPLTSVTIGKFPFILNTPLSNPSRHFSGNPSKPYTLSCVNSEIVLPEKTPNSSHSVLVSKTYLRGSLIILSILMK